MTRMNYEYYHLKVEQTYHLDSAPWSQTHMKFNSVAMQLQPSVPLTLTPVYTGMPLEKELLVASVFPVCFQWPSNGAPVCSNNAN